MTTFLRSLRLIAGAKTSITALAQTLASRLGILGINFATSILVARSLGPAGRGTVAALSLWPIFLCGITTFGLPTSLRYFVRRQPDDAKELFSTALVLGCLAGVIAFLLGLVIIPHALYHYSASAMHFALLLLLFAPQIMCNNMLQAFLESGGDFTQSNRVQAIPPAVTLGALLVLFEVHSLTPYSVPLAYFTPTVFVTIWTMYRSRHSFHVPRYFMRSSQLLLNYGLRAYGLNVLTTLSSQVDQAIIIRFLTAASFGLYGIALNVSSLLGIIAASVNAVIFPKASGLEFNDAVDLVARSARIVLASTLAAYALFLLLLPPIIYWVYGPAYIADIELTRILMLEVALGATCSTLVQAFLATGRPALATLLQGVGLLIAFPFMLVLIPRLGLVGAAYSLLISTALRLVFALLCFPLFLHHRIPGLLLTAEDWRGIKTRFSPR